VEPTGHTCDDPLTQALKKVVGMAVSAAVEDNELYHHYSRDATVEPKSTSFKELNLVFRSLEETLGAYPEMRQIEIVSPSPPRSDCYSDIACDTALDVTYRPPQ